jgi:hypothetical protein
MRKHVNMIRRDWKYKRYGFFCKDEGKDCGCKAHTRKKRVRNVVRPSPQGDSGGGNEKSLSNGQSVISIFPSTMINAYVRVVAAVSERNCALLVSPLSLSLPLSLSPSRRLSQGARHGEGRAAPGDCFLERYVRGRTISDGFSGSLVARGGCRLRVEIDARGVGGRG